MRGVQLGLLPASIAGENTGLQFSTLANETTRGRGLQFAALLNHAEDLQGLQLGLLNFNMNGTENLQGLQLALLNFNAKGFLPVFPFFNFGL